MQERLTALMRLPWTVKVEEAADGSLVAQIAEIPDAIGTGKGVRELARDLWESLYGSLEIRLEHDDEIPLPAGSILPWNADVAAQGKPGELHVRQPIGPLVIQFRATAA